MFNLFGKNIGRKFSIRTIEVFDAFTVQALFNLTPVQRWGWSLHQELHSAPLGQLSMPLAAMARDLRVGQLEKLPLHPQRRQSQHNAHLYLW